MRTIKSNFATVSRNYEKLITLYDNKSEVVCQPLFESVYENVEIVFNDNGSITLTGDEWQFGIEFHDVYPSELDYEVHPDYIKLTKFRKKQIVQHGWHRKLNNEKRIITMTNYKLIEK